MSQLYIKQLTDDAIGKWDEFVSHCPEATFFHRAGWKRIIEKSFGHKTYYLYAQKDDQIQGILPLGHIKSLFFGNALVSTPFCVYGGVASISKEARQALYDAASELTEKLKADHLELRNLNSGNDDWPKKDLYVTFRKEIDPDPEVNMKQIPRKQRAMVRKGIQAELETEIDNDVERFFNIYALSVRNHGTPVFTKRYFRLLKEEFKDDCEIMVITKNGQPISTVLSFYFRDEVLPYYGGGTELARKYKGFDYMYWQVMCRACERGFRIFDYGRSKKGTGSYSFKKNWGFEPQQLNYEYYLVGANEVPDVNPLNPKYQLFISMWQKLPIPISKILGPLISKDLG
jgi:FemAB-related protein (PEP-CTERM system-associated)